MGAFLVIGILAAIFLAHYLGRLIRQRREESFQRLASELGYSLTDHERGDFVSAYAFLDLFAADRLLSASTVFSGNRGDMRVRMFHLIDETEPQDEARTCVATVVLIELPGQRFPHLRVSPGNGPGQTGIGPPKFSSKYDVACDDVEFARAMVEGGAWASLARSVPTSVEMDGYVVALHREGCLSAGELRRLHRIAWSFIEAIPGRILGSTLVDGRHEPRHRTE
jgi:hypothetical protein